MQAVNPFLPIDTYIPDGEPHVFGDRVYLFGSHDKENGNTFCMLDYEIWSAPVNDLGAWSSKGINYRSSQDPLSKITNRPYMYAPDCVKGNDGKYYLYYCLSGVKGRGGYFGPISVAVCDTPDGQYEFYGHVKNSDGTLLKRFVPFDPAVINDEGIIRLYYGTWYPFDEMPKLFRPIMRKVQSSMFNKTVREIKAEDGGIMGAVCCTVADDMLTVKEQPKLILPAKTKGTPFESKLHPFGKDGHFFGGHGFFEGASIRKINGKYYFIYSSVNNHELCYATSDYPDKDFTYGGVIISNGDVGYNGRAEKDRLNHTGTNHGSIVEINGEWYVFYHRQTHGSDYSRQAVAERIAIMRDGSIPQAEMTSCGLNGGALRGEGRYSAVICCNLSNGRMPHGGNKSYKNLPTVYSRGDERYLSNLNKNTVIAYKYFNLNKSKFLLTARGKGRCTVCVNEYTVAKVNIDSDAWKVYAVELEEAKDCNLSFKIEKGRVEILEFEFCCKA